MMAGLSGVIYKTNTMHTGFVQVSLSFHCPASSLHFFPLTSSVSSHLVLQLAVRISEISGGLLNIVDPLKADMSSC